MKIIDHIAIFENCFTEEFCKEHIQFFKKNQLKYLRDNEKVQDESVSLKYWEQAFLEMFWKKCYPEYLAQYPILKELTSHKILDIKIQKTKPGQGYPYVHCENMSMDSRNRILVFILYLNTVDDGETYFETQNLKIKPEQGKLVLWPANFTHAHKGLPPKQEKYILTGWVEYGI